MAQAAAFCSCVLLYIVSRYIYGTPSQAASQTLYATEPYPEEVRGPTVYGTLLFDVFALRGFRELPRLSKGEVSECD